MAKTPHTCDISEMTGPQKAAVMFLAMGDERAARLFAQMSDDEIREVSQHMVSLGSVDAGVVEQLLVEFVGQMSNVGSLHGTYEAAERILLKGLEKSRVEEIMQELRGPAGRTMWDKLGNVNEEVLATYLKNEYPQTVAVVLAKIKPAHAARVLSALPEDFSMEVIMRMLTMEAVRKEVLDNIEKTLRNEFMSNLARTARVDAHERMAEIFNNFDRSTEQRFMTALEERSRDPSERIKAPMFTFEDLIKLDPSSVQTLLRNLDKAGLALALKGTSETLRDLFFSNMSERAGKILREDMEAMGPVRPTDVDEAQAAIINKAKELATAGEIVIAEGGGEDQLVY
ncbi:MAG: flagellar motor switch protein FliG [Alphaproteobacteria bacterium]|nr:flagellar motor switch protein FliG [Alphaproteobacteria bacterium]